MAITAYNLIGPTSGAINTKGAYTQIVASTPYDSSRLFVSAEFGSAPARLILMDVATGAAGAETVIVADVAFYIDFDSLAGAWIPLSIDVPAGTRLAVRVQSQTATVTATLHFYLDSRARASLANPVTYGTVAASSRGTQIDPGGTANTKSAYVQFSASTPSRIDTVLVCLTVATAGTAMSGLRWAVDVATGAAGAETVVLPDVTVAANSVANSARTGVLFLPVSIAAGTRLAVRASCSATTAGVRLLAVTLLGMQEPATSGGGGATSVAYLG